MIAVALAPLVIVIALYRRSTSVWWIRAVPICAFPALVMASGDFGVDDGTIEWLFLGAQVGLDLTGRIFLFASALIWFVAGLFSIFTGIHGGNPRRFYRFFCAAMAGNFLLIIAGDVITFLSGFALMSYAGYGLVVHKRSHDARRAAKIYVVLVVLGEVLLFAGAVLAWGLAGSWELASIREALSSGSTTANFAVGLLFAGFGVKAGMIPLHVWLPLAHPAAPVPASAVLSAAMIKGGLLGWMRFLPFGNPGLEWLGIWALTAGLVAALGAVVIGLFQTRPKTILAYSSISQMGYMTVLLALAALAPQLYPAVLTAVLVYVLHHAVAKGALFLSVTVAGGAPHRWWWKVLEPLGLIVPALALAGAPLTSGAVAKTELKVLPYLGEGDLPGFVDPALIVGAVATTVLMARFLWVVWPRSRRRESVSRAGRFVWVLLATAVVWGPFIVPWGYLRDVAWTTFEPATIWSAFWPLALGAMLSLIVLRLPHVFPFRIEGWVPAGDLLVPLERWWFAAKDGGLKALTSMIEAAEDRARIGAKWATRWAKKLRVLEVLEARLQQQAWDWIWILVVGAVLLAAMLL